MAAAGHPHLMRTAHSLLSCSAAAIRTSPAPSVAATSSARIRPAAMAHVLRSRQASTSTRAQQADPRRKGRQTRRTAHGRPAGLGALAGTLLSFSLLGAFGQGESASHATSPLKSINLFPQVSSVEVHFYRHRTLARAQSVCNCPAVDIGRAFAILSRDPACCPGW